MRSTSPKAPFTRWRCASCCRPRSSASRFRCRSATGTPKALQRCARRSRAGTRAKSLAHPGLRLGWIVAPPALLAEVVRRQDYTIGTSPLCQLTAQRLLERRAQVLARSRRILDQNLAIFDGWLKERDRGTSYRPPEAGGMVFVRYRAPLPSTEQSRRLRERESVFVVAGDWFGLDGYVRIGIGGEAVKLERGLARLGVFLDRMAG